MVLMKSPDRNPFIFGFSVLVVCALAVVYAFFANSVYRDAHVRQHQEIQLQQSDVAPPPQCVKVHSQDTGSTGSLGTGVTSPTQWLDRPGLSRLIGRMMRGLSPASAAKPCIMPW